MSDASCFLFHSAVWGHHKRLGGSVVSAPVYSQWWAVCPTALVIEAKRFIWSQALRSGSDRGARSWPGLERLSRDSQRPLAVFHPPPYPPPFFFVSIALLHLLLWLRRVSQYLYKECGVGRGYFFLFLLSLVSCLSVLQIHMYLHHTRTQTAHSE